MTPFQEAFEKAEKTEHPVEKQWHYPIMINFGYVPLTPSQIGFVREYIYEHPVSRHQIHLHTGVNVDYWRDSSNNGYHSSLKQHLQTL